MDDIYNSRILEFAGNIPRSGRLEPADAEAVAHSKLCGSKVKVTIRMSDGRITDFAHDVKACALGQASSSIMARNVVGAEVGEVRAAREAMIAMLKADGEGPDGRFADMRILRPVKDYKARHASTLLTFDALVDAIAQVEARQTANVDS